MAGPRLVTRVAANKRLLLLFSTVLVLFVARLGLADESGRPGPDSASAAFEDFLEFESLAGAEMRKTPGSGCAARPSGVPRPLIKPVLSDLAGAPSNAASQEDETIVLGSTGYNYQRHR